MKDLYDMFRINIYMKSNLLTKGLKAPQKTNI